LAPRERDVQFRSEKSVATYQPAGEKKRRKTASFGGGGGQGTTSKEEGPRANHGTSASDVSGFWRLNSKKETR